MRGLQYYRFDVPQGYPTGFEVTATATWGGPLGVVVNVGRDVQTDDDASNDPLPQCGPPCTGPGAVTNYKWSSQTSAVRARVNVFATGADWRTGRPYYIGVYADAPSAYSVTASFFNSTIVLQVRRRMMGGEMRSRASTRRSCFTAGEPAAARRDALWLVRLLPLHDHAGEPGRDGDAHAAHGRPGCVRQCRTRGRVPTAPERPLRCCNPLLLPRLRAQTCTSLGTQATRAPRRRPLMRAPRRARTSQTRSSCSGRR